MPYYEFQFLVDEWIEYCKNQEKANKEREAEYRKQEQRMMSNQKSGKKYI